jgi:hypothetical protein
MFDMIIAFLLFSFPVLNGSDPFASAQWAASWLPTISITLFLFSTVIMLLFVLVLQKTCKTAASAAGLLWLLVVVLGFIQYWLSVKIAAAFLAATSFSTVTWSLVAAAIIIKFCIAYFGKITKVKSK